MSAWMNGPRQPTFRPMEIGEILDNAFKIYMRAWRTLIPIGLIGALPGLILSVASGSTMTFNTRDPMNSPMFRYITRIEQGDFTPVFVLLGGYLAFAVASILLYPWVQGAVVAVCSRTYLGMETSVGQALSISGGRYPRLLGTMLLTALMYIVALPAGLIGGLVIFSFLTVPAAMIWVGVNTAFNSHVIVVEGAGGGTPAIRRSFQLVKGRFWPLLGLGFIFSILISVATQAVTYLVTIPAVLLQGSMPWLTTASVLIATLVTAAVLPFKMVGLTLAYYDTRMRKEGFDLEMLARSQMPGMGMGPQ